MPPPDLSTGMAPFRLGVYSTWRVKINPAMAEIPITKGTLFKEALYKIKPYKWQLLARDVMKGTNTNDDRFKYHRT